MRPEMRVYERNIARMAEPFNIMNRRIAQTTKAGGASTAAQVAALSEGRRDWNKAQTEMYGQTMDAMSQSPLTGQFNFYTYERLKCLNLA